MSGQFELLFEGPADDSPPTLRRIKGVFVADLEFPANDVQRFLESAPICIKSASTQEELKKSYDLLSKAGARVLIVSKPAEEEKNSLDMELPALELEFDSVLKAVPAEKVPLATEALSSLDLSIDFGVEENKAEEVKPPEPKKSKLDDFDPSSLSFNLSLVEPELPAAEVKQESIETNDSLDLSLRPIEEKKAEEPQTEELDSGLELEVVTSQSSTLFGGNEQNLEKVETTPEIKPKSEVVKVEAVKEVAVEVPPSEKLSEPMPTIVAEEVEDEPIELTLEELKKLQKQARKKIKISNSYLLAVLSLVLLFLGNRIYFSNNKYENPFLALVDQLPKLSTEPSKEEQEKELAQKAAEMAKTAWFTFEQNYPNRSVKSSIWVENNIPVHGTIEVTTPQPAPLTKEEIVNGVQPRVWLRRLEVKDLNFKKDGPSYSASGPALAYVSIGETNIRFPGIAKLRVKLLNEKFLNLEAWATHDNSLQQFSENTLNSPAVLNFSYETNGENKKFELFEKMRLSRP